jgi:hypothetical protein
VSGVGIFVRAFSNLHGIREDGAAIAVAGYQGVVPAATGRNCQLIGIDLASDWGAGGVNAMQPVAWWTH